MHLNLSVTGVQAYSPKIHNTFPEIWLFYQLISWKKWNIIFIGRKNVRIRTIYIKEWYFLWLIK